MSPELENLKKDFEQFAHCTSHALSDPLREIIIKCNELEKEHSSSAGEYQLFKSLAQDVLNKVVILRNYSHLFKEPDFEDDIDVNRIISDITQKFPSRKFIISQIPPITADLEQIIILFKEVIDNAVKFSSSGEIILTYQDKGSNHLFTISDQGIGFDQVYEKIVFMLLQKLDEEDKHDSKGAGLAFCKKIVENHKGKIWLKSEENKGTEVFFTLAKGNLSG